MSFKGQLIPVVINEWMFFDQDQAGSDHRIGGVNKEAVGKYNDRVADYWRAIPSASYADLLHRFAAAHGRLDGTINLAWSAAFISFCMKTAGAGAAFPYSSGHVTWIAASIKNRLKGSLNANLVGFRPGEQPVELGDLIGYTRDTEKDVDYDNASTVGWFSSHSDIVVRVDPEHGRLVTIGGNVSQSVASKHLSLASDGRMINIPDKCIVHIRNNIDVGGLIAMADVAMFEAVA